MCKAALVVAVVVIVLLATLHLSSPPVCDVVLHPDGTWVYVGVGRMEDGCSLRWEE